MQERRDWDFVVRAPGISADGRLLAVPQPVLGNEIEVGLWTLPDGRRLGARFSPDGRRFAVGNRYGETRVYDTATFKPVTRVLSSDAGAIVDAAVTRDGRTLATGSETGAVQHLVAAYDTGRAYLWDIRPASLAEHACDVAGRRLTRSEWAGFLPGRDYDPAC